MTKQLSKEDMICVDCVGDSELKKRIMEKSKEGICVSCNTNSKGISLEILALWVDKVYRNYYQPGPFSCGILGVSYQRGSVPEDIIKSMVEVDHDISVFLTKLLREQECCDANKDDVKALYASGINYVMNDTCPHELHKTWCDFRDRVKFKRRFFDDRSEKLLKDLFEGIAFFNPDEELQPGDYIYRARVASTLEEAKEIKDDIPVALGPPPVKLNKGGRMNPSGISVFYGAFSKETCIAEVRPVVGGFVVLGKFEVLRPIRLFDLSKFVKDFLSISMFSKNYGKNREYWLFFRDFHYFISKPIQPFEEFLEYVPTQVVSEFLAKELKYDGIIYSSAQFDSETTDKPNNLDRLENIALFNAENIIKVEKITEDKNKVWEKTGSVKRPSNFDKTLKNKKDKQPILKLVSNNTELYNITSVSYKYKSPFDGVDYYKKQNFGSYGEISFV